MTIKEQFENDLKYLTPSFVNDNISTLQKTVKEAFTLGWNRCEDAIASSSDVKFNIHNMRNLLNNMLREIRTLTSANYTHHQKSLEYSTISLINMIAAQEEAEQSGIVEVTNESNSDYFKKNVEYQITQAENEEAKAFLIGKRVHMYSANCSCPGNKIKINAIGTITECAVREDGEYLYTFIPDGETSETIITTRSNFIKFQMID